MRKLLFVIGLLLAACGGSAQVEPTMAPTDMPSATSSPTPPSASDVTTPLDAPVALPDRTLTPGDLLTSDVSTVCTPGYTKTVRNVTTAEKRTVDAEYRWTYAPGKQEYDHLIPLELGGSNSIKNLWPEPIADARIKDRLENELHRRVCAGALAIGQAQQCIAVNWYVCWLSEGNP